MQGSSRKEAQATQKGDPGVGGVQLVILIVILFVIPQRLTQCGMQGSSRKEAQETQKATRESAACNS
jgi:hypothetical protein